MLVATIAATATFKWLTSESRASAARMAQNEARQAAIAGLTTARAWMMGHGNETGSLIRQYNSNGKKPIHLNNILRQMGTNVGGQKFDVWLVSADTDEMPYRLKIVSMGESRNGSKFSEVGIMKVSGLFQVKVPIKKVGISFNKAFFGKSKGITGDDSLESGIINGDFGSDNNIPNIKDQLLVTGNLSYQGGTGQGGDLYVGGNFVNRGSLYLGNVETNGYSSNYANCKTSGVDTVVAYVGGNLSGCDGGLVAVCGDLYVGGDVAANCRLKVAGNLTINGTLYRDNGGHGLGVQKNFVFTDKAAWSQQESYTLSNGDGSRTTLKVGVNFVLPPNLYGNIDQNSDYSIDLSGKMMTYTSANTVLLEQMDHNPKYYGVFKDGTSAAIAASDGRRKVRYLSFNADGGILNRGVGKWDESDNALKNIGSNYWERLRKMQAYGNLIAEDGKVPTPILLEDENSWKLNTKNSVCGLGNTFDFDDATILKLNSCYANHKEALTNGFLVIRWSNQYKKDPTKALDGKFVFYCPNKLSMTTLPKTTENSVVMLFLEQGAGTLLGGGTPFKYFIYSRANIDEIQQIKLSGSVIMDGDYSILNKYQNKNNLTYDAVVVEELLNAKFIKGNEEFERRAGMSVGGAGSSSVSDSEAKDSVYVALSPHLKVSLEAEYKNKEYDEDELSENGENVKPSFLILPRIIYLPKDAKGKLSDYYQVVNLNGASEVKNPNNVSCSPSLPTTSNFRDYSASIKQDIFNCTYSSGDYGSNSFYVVISGSSGDDPTVNFEKENIEISNSTSATVNVLMSKPKAATVDIYQTREPDGWSVDQVPKTINGDGSKVYTIDLSSSVTPVFHVNIEPGASVEGAIHFQMVEPCEGCLIGSVPMASVVGEGTFTVFRRGVDAFCQRENMKDDPDCKVGGKWYDEVNAPECGSLLPSSASAWVQARGVDCMTHTANDEWFCSIYINPNIHLQSLGKVNGCHVANPSENGGYNLISSPVGRSDTLYASLKRDIHTLTINFEKAEDSDTKVVISRSMNDGERAQRVGECKRGETCKYTVYAGYTYYLDADKKMGKDRFSHWKCTSGNCPVPENNRVSILVNDDYDMVAVYNESDLHCLFEDFAPDDENNGFTAFCDGTSNRCIDLCSTTPEPGKSCRVSEAAHWRGLGDNLNPDWVMVYDNKAANSSCKWNYSGCFCSDREYKACRLSCRQKICTTTKSGTTLGPIISNNFIVANSQADEFSNVENATQSVILSTKDNGYNGTMTSIFSVPIIDVNTAKGEMLNSGFIFRATDNASEYYSLSIYGKHAGGKYSPYVYGKLCYVTGQTASETDNACVEKYLSTSEWGVDENGGFTSLTKLGLVLKLQNERVTLDLTVDHQQLKNKSNALSFSLKELFGTAVVMNDANHNHVGFKLTDKDFKLYDISWSNSDFGEENCFSVPKLVCSFKTNYLGGMVPLNESVTPWVSFSSFLLDDYKGCEIKYYYNGCDNDVSYDRLNEYLSRMDYWREIFNNFRYCNANGTDDALGIFWENGRAMRNENFKFTKEGKHGYFYEDLETHMSGFVKDAKVKLECPVGVVIENEKSSLMIPSSCGEFYVGEIAACEKNHDFMDGIVEGITCSGSCSFEVTENEGFNARDAKILMSVDNPGNNRFQVVFTDMMGVRSTAYASARSGEIEFDINDYSNEDGFDPQKVVRVDISVSQNGYITVNSLKSSCPNALGIDWCQVSYKGEHWEVKTSVRNADQCSVIKPTISNAEPDVGPGSEDLSCPGVFRLKEPNLYVQDNEESYVFTISASKGSGDNQITETLKCDPYVIVPVEIHCRIDGKKTVEQGEGIPSLKYHFENCPTEGCSYTVNLGSYGAVAGGPVAGGPGNELTVSQNTTGFNMVNKSGNVLPKGTYNYVIDVGGKQNSPGECGFEVIEVQKQAEIPSCSFDATTKIFTADVKILKGSTWFGEVYVTDQNGNVLQNLTQSFKDQTSNHISVDFSTATFSPGTNFILFTVDGGGANAGCGKTYEYTPLSNLTLSCPPGTIDAELEQGTFEIKDLQVGGCDSETNPCWWSISKGSITSQGASSLSIKDESATLGNNTYTLSLNRKKASGGTTTVSCPINVNFVKTSSLEFTCPDNWSVTDVAPRSNVTITPPISGCNYDCSYWIKKGSTVVTKGDSYMDGDVTFADNNATSGSTSYTIEVKDATGVSKTCPFSVTYTGSSSGNTECEIGWGAGQPGQPIWPTDQEYPSGTCFEVTGVWKNEYWTPDLYLNCNSTNNMAGIKITYGGSSWESDWNLRVPFSSVIKYTESKSTFVKNICVYSTSSSPTIKCNWGT